MPIDVYTGTVPNARRRQTRRPVPSRPKAKASGLGDVFGAVGDATRAARRVATRAVRAAPKPAPSRSPVEVVADVVTGAAERTWDAVKDESRRHRVSPANTGTSSTRITRPTPANAKTRLAKDLLDPDPIGTALRRSEARTRRARAALPNPTRLARFPILPSYTPEQKRAILTTQAPRLQALMRETGYAGDDLERLLAPEDQRQVRVFRELVQENAARNRQGLAADRSRDVRRLQREGMSAADIAATLAPASASPGRPGASLGERAGGVLERAGGVLGDAADAVSSSLSTATGVERLNQMAGIREPLDDVLNRAGRALGLPTSAEVGEALTNPDRFLSSPAALEQPGLAQTARIQQGILGLTGFLSGAVDEGAKRGLVGGGGNGVQSAGLPDDISVNFLKDAINLPAEVIPSAYYPASLVAEGRTREAVRTFTDPYVELAKDPGGMLREHPLITALMVAGPVRGVSGAIGSAGRGAGIRAFSTERAPATAPGVAAQEARRYSKDPIVKAGQVLRETAARRQQAALRREAGSLSVRAGREPDRRAALEQAALERRDRAARLDPDRLSEKHLNRLTDEIEGVNLSATQRGRDEATRAPRELVSDRHAKRAGDALSPIAQGIVRPTVESVRRYRDDLEEVFRSDVLTAHEKGANRALRAGLDDAIRHAENGRVDFGQVRRLVDQHYRPIVRRLQVELDAKGILPRARAERAELVPYAVREMGARYDARKSAPEHMAERYAQAKALEDAARGAVRSARVAERRADARLHRARRLLGSQQGRSGVAQGRAEILSDQAIARARRELPKAREAVQRAQQALARERTAARVHGRATPFEARRRLRQAEDKLSDIITAVSHGGGRDGDHAIAQARGEVVAARRGVEQSNAVAEAERRVAARRGRLLGLTAMAEGRMPAGTLRRLERERAEYAARERAVDRARAELGAARDARRRAEKAARAARKQRKSANPKKYTTGLVDADGRRIPTKDIRAHIRRTGADDPLFVTQAPNRRGAGNFYRHWSRPGTTGQAVRTGESTRRGTFDANPETLVEQVARMQGLLDANGGWERFIREMGFRRDKKLTSFNRRADAEKAAKALSERPGSFGWTVVSLHPWRAHPDAIESLLDPGLLDSEAALSVGNIMRDAIEGNGDGPFGLVPTTAANRMMEHTRALGPSGPARMFRAVSQRFSQVVLTTSKNWMVSNALEGGLRAAIARATPLDAINAKRVIERVHRYDPAMAEELRILAAPGGHFSFSARAIKTTVEHFDASSPRLAHIARALGAFTRAPGARHLGELWSAYTRSVFALNQKVAEGPAQAMIAGAYMRKQYNPGKVLLWGEKAIEQAARGLMNTPEQVAMGRALREDYGQYAFFSPMQRKVKQVAPFFAWAQNAAKFLYVVLPRDHPVLTGLLADMHMGSEAWRKSRGLDKFIDGRLPDFLQGSIPLSGGRHFRASRFGPFGLLSAPLNTIADLLLPQLSGPLMAFQGLDWKGQPLRDRNGRRLDELETFKYAVEEFASGVVPFLSKYDQYKESEGSTGARALRLVNPFEATAGRRVATVTRSSDGAVDPRDDLVNRVMRGGSSADGMRRMDDLVNRVMSGG